MLFNGSRLIWVTSGKTNALQPHTQGAWLLAGPAGGAARSRTVLEYKHYSLVMTEPLFNFEAMRSATEEVGGGGRRKACRGWRAFDKLLGCWMVAQLCAASSQTKFITASHV